MLALAWVESIAQAIVSYNAVHGAKRMVLVTLSVLLTFSMFVAIQAVQVGLRALVTDNCTSLQQSRANTWAGRHINFAGTLAYLAAYVDLPRYFHGLGKTVFAHTSVPTAVYLMTTVSITCWYTTEQEHRSSKVRTTRRVADSRVIRNVLFGPSSQIRTICLVQFFSWLGWFPFLFYTVTYVCSTYFPSNRWYANVAYIDTSTACVSLLPLRIGRTFSLTT